MDHPSIDLIGCCNELNAGYAADGDCRATMGLGVVCVTYMVGGLSAINAVAGAFSESLPLLVISGAPNSNDHGSGHLIHHTIGLPDLRQQSRVFTPVTSGQFIVNHISEACLMIDDSIKFCLGHRRPVYLEIPCNFSTKMVVRPQSISIPEVVSKKSDPVSLSAATRCIIELLEASIKPCLVAGGKIRRWRAQEAFNNLAKALECAVAVMPDAKGEFSEEDENFIGVFWAPSVSSPFCAEVCESSDLLIYVGPIFNDYSTCGWSALLNRSKIIEIQHDYVIVKDSVFSFVQLGDVLKALACDSTPKRPASLLKFKRFAEGLPPSHLSAVEVHDDNSTLTLAAVRKHLQNLVTSNTTLITETGTSWFLGHQLNLKQGTQYFAQMEYGSIGWSLPAAFGISLALSTRDVILIIGDGALQCTLQEVAQMIRYEINIIIFVLNNHGYSIEVEIHDGPYNAIPDISYADLIDCFGGSNGADGSKDAEKGRSKGSKGKESSESTDTETVSLLKHLHQQQYQGPHSPTTTSSKEEKTKKFKKRGLGFRVTTAGELALAVDKVKANCGGVCLIECIISPDDCTPALLEFGSRVAAANGRP